MGNAHLPGPVAVVVDVVRRESERRLERVRLGVEHVVYSTESAQRKAWEIWAAHRSEGSSGCPRTASTGTLGSRSSQTGQNERAVNQSNERTMKNVSILSSTLTGIWSTLSTVAKPPLGTRQCFKIARKMFHP